MKSTLFTNNQRLLSVFRGSSSIRAGDYDRTAVSLIQLGLLLVGMRMPKTIALTGVPDGKFGSETQNVVKALQAKSSLRADGIVGTNTLNILNNLLVALPPGCVPFNPPVVTLDPLPISVTVPTLTRYAKQPKDHVCWAAVAAMMCEYHSVIPIPQSEDALRVPALVALLDAKIMLSGAVANGKFTQIYNRNDGIDDPQAKELFTKGVGLTASPAGPVTGIAPWIRLLQKGRPVVLYSMRYQGANKMGGHFIIVTGAHQAEYVPPTIAPLTSFDPVLEQILGRGVVDIIDPKMDVPWKDKISIRDLDVVTGYIPAPWWPPDPDGVINKMNARTRTYY
jgi:Putative peptidoglycan binding domain/Papain-like cysteine protease AvrRpt2